MQPLIRRANRPTDAPHGDVSVEPLGQVISSEAFLLCGTGMAKVVAIQDVYNDNKDIV